MSEPPEDEDQERRIEALPGSELPRWPDDDDDWDAPYAPADAGQYRVPDPGDLDAGDLTPPEPLAAPRRHTGEFPRVGGNRFRAQPEPPRQVSARLGYGQHHPPPGGVAPPAAGNARDQDAGDAGDARSVKMALWGSPGSGKTTFLAVLRHATYDPDSDIGTWEILPVDEFSRRMMANFTHDLAQGRFPRTTQPGEEVPLAWRFEGDITRSRFVPWHARMRRPGRIQNQFTLDLIDVSGKAFGYVPGQEDVPRSVADQALNRLIEADGIIYLFDPIAERDNHNSFDYVNRAITELKLRRGMRRNGSRDVKQPIAVVVTKFDDPAVFQQARRNGFVSYDQDGTPRVPDEDAEQFFELLCTDRFWSNSHKDSARSADFLRRELRGEFDDIQYFVTSSVGFYRERDRAVGGWRFDPSDFVNVRRVAGNEPRIRGTISPINVLEPLIGVQQRIAGRRQR
jgi:GTPase SAR1 family protein